MPQAYLVLNVTADLRSVFTWNTKQLFLYVNVDFATPSNPGNSMVMWSQIVRASEDAVLEAPYLRSGYPFAVTDQRQEMLGREFNVTVVWHVMPRVGRLYKDSRTFSGEWRHARSGQCSGLVRAPAQALGWACGLCAAIGAAHALAGRDVPRRIAAVQGLGFRRSTSKPKRATSGAATTWMTSTPRLTRRSSGCHIVCARVCKSRDALTHAGRPRSPARQCGAQGGGFKRACRSARPPRP